MCTSPKGSNAAQQQAQAEAAEARAREEQRQERIRTGRGKIDEAYAGFNDAYFDQFRKTALDAALPQVQQQAGDARQDLVYALERAGTRNSSIAGDRASALERDVALREGEARGAADTAAQQLRTKVTDSRAAAERDLMLTEDPTRASNDALARTATLRAETPAPSMVGPLFEGAALGWQAYQQGKRQVAADGMAARLLQNLEGASRISR
jgi:hypothetical protein